MFRQAPAAAALSLLGLVAWVYGAGLDRSPAYLVHDDLARGTVYVDLKTLDLSTVPQASLLLCRVGDEGPLLAAGLTRVTAIPEPDGVPWFSVLRR